MTTAQHRLEEQTPSAAACAGPENALVAAATAGDAACFEMLVRRYRRTVLAIAQRMTGNSDDAEDIAQQTFMKVFVKLSTFQGKSAFSTWLISIAMNEARMWRRKRSRSREFPAFDINTEQETEAPLEISDPRPDAESACLTREREALLFARLNELRPAARRALELCDLQEESTSRTALLLGITVSAVKSRRSRGRAELRRALAYHFSRSHQGMRLKKDLPCFQQFSQ